MYIGYCGDGIVRMTDLPSCTVRVISRNECRYGEGGCIEHDISPERFGGSKGTLSIYVDLRICVSDSPAQLYCLNCVELISSLCVCRCITQDVRDVQYMIECEFLSCSYDDFEGTTVYSSTKDRW